MFKKLVVGALATGIALTGGIGAASASTESTESSVNKMAPICESYYYIGNGKYERYIYYSDEIYPDSFQEYTCHGLMQWHLKNIDGSGVARYEGRVQ
ncbi:hypothetical protein OCB15_21750 [Bacillus cereus]|nr:hypothetical protein [Bacillus cereus]